MFGWLKKSNEKENSASVAVIQPKNEAALPLNPIQIADILLLEKAENWREMIAKCDVWASQQPLNPLPYFSSGNAYLKIGKPVTAVEMFRKAIDISNQPVSTFPPSVFNCLHEWYGLGRAYTQLRNWDEAENAFLQAISIDPRVPDIWNDLAVVYMDLKPYDIGKAFEALKRAIEVDPNNVRESLHNSCACVFAVSPA
jgi:tetratricopeptide (TPR) repeat protein